MQSLLTSFDDGHCSTGFGDGHCSFEWGNKLHLAIHRQVGEVRQRAYDSIRLLKFAEAEALRLVRLRILRFVCILVVMQVTSGIVGIVGSQFDLLTLTEALELIRHRSVPTDVLDGVRWVVPVQTSRTSFIAPALA